MLPSHKINYLLTRVSSNLYSMMSFSDHDSNIKCKRIPIDTILLVFLLIVIIIYLHYAVVIIPHQLLSNDYQNTRCTALPYLIRIAVGQLAHTFLNHRNCHNPLQLPNHQLLRLKNFDSKLCCVRENLSVAFDLISLHSLTGGFSYRDHRLTLKMGHHLLTLS